LGWFHLRRRVDGGQLELCWLDAQGCPEGADVLVERLHSADEAQPVRILAEARRLRVDVVDVAVEEQVVQSPAREIEDEGAEALHREQWVAHVQLLLQRSRVPPGRG